MSLCNQQLCTYVIKTLKCKDICRCIQWCKTRGRWVSARLYTAIHCNPLQHTATHCNTLQHTTTNCNTLQHTATHAMHCNACVHHHLRRGADDQWDIRPTSEWPHVCSYIYTHIYMYLSTHVDTHLDSTHCNTLQHTATHCNTLQHTATHCKVCSVLHLDAASAWLTEILHSTLHTCIHASIYTCRHTSRHYTTHMYKRIYLHISTHI